MTTFRQYYYSFPIRLLVLHWRNHLLLVSLWVFLGMLITGTVGRFFGIHYLLLTPEYRGMVNFWSFFLTGMSFGVFFMIWNLTTYLLCASRFPFLATLDAPFTKFSLNNAIIPLGFLTTYLASTVWFQVFDEFSSYISIAKNVLGFLSGTGFFIALLAGYLYLTNHDIVSLDKLGKLVPKDGGKLFAPGRRLPTVREIRTGATRWRVDTYLNERLHARLVRSVVHYDLDILEKVFRQNHVNAVVVQVAALFLLMTLGLFMDSEWCRIPTGATIFLLGSMFMAVFGAVAFWFRNWGALVFFGILLMANWLTSWGLFNFRNAVYGLDYRKESRTVYDNARLEEISSAANIAEDKANTIKILENWLQKNKTPNNPKPKMLFICSSGGGVRSALWTMQTLREADKATKGRLMRQTALMSGASGGMLGAGFMRELMLQKQEGKIKDLYNFSYLEDIGKDLLNPVCFAIISNDLLIPWRTFKSGNFKYRKDRGYIFEQQFNENCGNVFNKRLADYRKPEAEAKIPLFFITPFLLNDSRRLLISPQGVSYMMKAHNRPSLDGSLEIDGVDFGRLFARQDADSMTFTSALRMNCTYPYILPNAFLPSKPMLEVMDAGFRDNYGVLTAARFIQVFRDWITENTGGVVLIQVRCWEKFDPILETDQKGIIEKFLSPATAAGHSPPIQDYEQDNVVSMLDGLLGETPLDIVLFTYRPIEKKREASMNLHLSNREKADLIEAFYTNDNRESIEKLKFLLPK